MKCPHCNSDIADDSKFCSSCGKKILTQNNFFRTLYSLLSIKMILLFIAIGIWIIVLQNIGIIPIDQDVRVTNEEVTTHVRGGYVNVDNTVDVNIN